MRILATTAPDQGHFFPMVPLLWALRNAGHDILVAAPDTFAGVVAATGLSAVPLGDDLLIDDMRRPSGNGGSGRPGTDSLVRHVTEYYVPLSEQHAEATVELAGRWRPDLVVHTGWEYAGPLAAARFGIPSILHGWGMAPPRALDAPIAEALSPLHGAWGLQGGVPDPYWWVDVCPPSLQVGAVGLRVLPMACVPYSGSGVVPPWLLARGEATRICVTLGHIPIMGEHGSVLTTVLQALNDVSVENGLEVVIAASDRLGDISGLPSNTRILRGLPLSAILPTCDVVIHHGGAGSTLATLAHGVPALALPQMGVQYQHADRIAEVGAGRRLHPHEVTVATVWNAVMSLLLGKTHRGVAQRLRAEMGRQPHVSDVVKTIEAAFEI